MRRFELDRLTDFSDASLLAEIRRVAAEIGSDVITEAAFDKRAKVSSSTVRRRFGGWEAALEAAGLRDRYGGPSLTAKLKRQDGRRMSDEDLVNELRRVGDRLGVEELTQADFNSHSSISSKTIITRLGSWHLALQRVGLRLSIRGRRHSEEEYFENLLTVWTHYGRQPKYREMDSWPSTIPAGAYEAKWGGWTKALVAFVDRANRDVDPLGSQSAPSVEVASPALVSEAEGPGTAEKRKIPLGVRYDVLKRDRFRCVLCGRSPATHVGVELHVDHIWPDSKEGPATHDNLRTTCADCNIGKGNKIEE
jgi:hypothetical protein